MSTMLKLKRRLYANRYVQWLLPRTPRAHLRPCFYCGERHTVLDHVPPIALVENYIDKDDGEKLCPFLLVPACADCNSRLNAKPIPTLYERVTFIANELARKYASAVYWTEEQMEAAELHEEMRVEYRRLNEYWRRFETRVQFAYARLRDDTLYPD